MLLRPGPNFAAPVGHLLLLNPLWNPLWLRPFVRSVEQKIKAGQSSARTVASRYEARKKRGYATGGVSWMAIAQIAQHRSKLTLGSARRAALR
jgi:hypothetical protein